MVEYMYSTVLTSNLNTEFTSVVSYSNYPLGYVESWRVSVKCFKSSSESANQAFVLCVWSYSMSMSFSERANRMKIIIVIHVWSICRSQQCRWIHLLESSFTIHCIRHVHVHFTVLSLSSCLHCLLVLYVTLTSGHPPPQSGMTTLALSA